MKLSNTAIGNIQPTDKDQEITDDKVLGLKVRIGKSGTKTFYLYYKIDGRKRKYKIGKFGEIGLPVARKAAEKLKAQIALGQDPQAQRQEVRTQAKRDKAENLRTFLDGHYYPFIETHQKSHQRTKWILEHNFKTFMAKPMSSISSLALDRWQKERLDQGTKPVTLNRALIGIKAVLNKAVEWNIIDANPIDRRKNLKVDQNGVIRWLSDDEENRLHEALENYPLKIQVIIKVLLNTGMRPMELLSLRWSDVDLAQKQITAHGAFTKTGQTRYTPLNSKAIECIQALKQDGEYLFPGNGPNAHMTSISKHWYKLVKDAKLENFRMYDLRHTFASKLVMKGVDLYTVSQLLGHSDITMTKRYAHLSPDHLRGAVDML